jgi:hypothetical protein
MRPREQSGRGEGLLKFAGPGAGQEGIARGGRKLFPAQQQSAAEIEHVVEIEQGVTHQAQTGSVGQGLGNGTVTDQRLTECGEHGAVEGGAEQCGAGSGSEFVESPGQTGFGREIESEWGLAEFGDSVAEGGGLLGTEPGVQTERGFELKTGFRGDSPHKNEVQVAEEGVEALEPGHALFHRHARLNGLIEGTESRDGGDGQRRRKELGTSTSRRD